MPITAPEGYLDISNATLRGSEIITTSNVGVMNANPTMALSVGSNLHVNVYSSNVLQVSGNIVAEGLKLGLIEIIPSYDFAAVSNVGNTTVSTIQFSNATTAFKTTSNIALGGHILPIANETYDIGSPEYKIRDLFVGTNSMWIGDQTKIAFENGKMKFKQRKLDKVPKVIKDLVINSVENSITTESEVESAAIAYVQAQFPDDSITALEDLKLQHWKAYTKTVDDTKEISDIFIDNDEDYNAQSSADAWREVGSNVYSTQRIGIGAATEPRAILDVNDTGAMIVPTGTTVQRPSTGIEGMFRYNSESGYLEAYTSSGWGSIATPPTITSFSPIGPITPAASNGTDLTINGSFFDQNTTVQLRAQNGTLYSTTNFVFTNSGLITVTLGSLATDSYTVVVTNGAGLSVDSTSTFAVNNPPVWSSPAAGATLEFLTTTSSTTTLSATDPDGGTVTYSLVSGTLPAGLTLSGSTISGTSGASGGTQTPITIRASDGIGFVDRSFTIKTSVPLYSFSSHTFTNAGATGRYGPTLTQCRNAYNVTWDNNTSYFNVVTQGIQEWTVPRSGTYRIEVAGAAGGVPYDTTDNTGFGAILIFNINLAMNDVICIVVGQRGKPENLTAGAYNSGGGGGTFVYNKTSSTPIAVAGGGGGGSYGFIPQRSNAGITTNGHPGTGYNHSTSSNFSGLLSGQSNGYGGINDYVTAYKAGGGGGWYGNGGGGHNQCSYTVTPGNGKPGNFIGGEGGNNSGGANFEDGGFGGGGGGTGACGASQSGGGGGYTGGGGLNLSSNNRDGLAGGGSYLDSSQTALVSINLSTSLSHGYAIITLT